MIFFQFEMFLEFGMHHGGSMKSFDPEPVQGGMSFCLRRLKKT